MKWKSHVEIARAIGDSMGLAPELTACLAEGSVQPDREADKIIRIDRRRSLYRARMRHHRADRRFVMNLVWRSRKAHLEGREEDALWCLGRALHYVQDLCVSVGPFHWFHDAREEDIAGCGVRSEAVEAGISASASSPHFVWGCLRSLRPGRHPAAVLYVAAMYSATISAAVLGESRPSAALLRELRRARRRYRFLIVASGLSAVAAGALAVAYGPLAALLMIPCLAAALLAHRGWRYMEREARWSGVRG